MMKRTAVPRIGPDEPQMQQQNPNQYHAKSNEQVLTGFSLFESIGSNVSNEIQQPGASNMHTLAQSAQPQILGSSAMLSVGGSGFGRSAPRASAPAVINYLKPGAVQYAPAKQTQAPPRIKPSLAPLPQLGRQSPAPQAAPPPCQPPQQQFQRLKVEDALSYLDQVKYKFNTQPQVYNDFLDIMKEFKSQTIDTPGVITRVSNLFKGHPELIVGFNTFLPPGYKIEVQSNGQVSVSMPSPTGLGTTGVLLGVHGPQQPQLVHLLPVPPSVSSAIVHNLSVSTAPTNTLHQISQAHQQIEAAAIHHAPGGTGGAGGHAPAAGQPVEFNHAIEYVNKIKSRFSRQPDKYKRFLEILHAYQRGHRDLKEPQAKQQTEQEVYSQVAKLFENQEDLLTEFGQFLPDAKAVTKPPEEQHYVMPTPQNENVIVQRTERETSPERFPAAAHHAAHHATPVHHAQMPKHSAVVSSSAPPPAPHHHLKRSPSFSSSNQLGSGAPPAKKSRGSCVWGGVARDVSYAEAAKLATVHDLNFFERARRALRHHHVYDNFLRCLLLFTNEIISSSELLSVTAPFLCRHPELHKWLQDFVGPPPPSPPHTPPRTVHTGYTSQYTSSEQLFERARSRERERARSRERYLPPGSARLEPASSRHDARNESTPAMDIDLSTCKRLGTSYCALPRDAAARRCSGRTPLCKEVLNDTWVSFPTWSEDSTFVTSRKTQYEEYIYRCEDERFELDVVIETNASTIRVLEGVQKKLSRMSSEEAGRFRLDDCLGGASPTIHQRALRRIYGDKAVDIIAGLKKNPVVAVPVVLRRLKAKEEEWREAQKGFNKQWREQNEKYYLKSLDHQGINFKQNDLKAMRSKSLFNEVESAYAARRPPPHLVVDYNMHSRQEAIKIVRDTGELLIHHARRQTGIQKAEKRRIKQLLRHFLPDLFNHPRQPLSDDERDDEEKEEGGSGGSGCDEPRDNADEKPSHANAEIKQESSESDNASDKSGKPSKNNKENKPKNNNTDGKDISGAANAVKRNSSNEEQASIKSDVKSEPADPEDDFRDYPPNEARFVCSMSWYLFLRVHGTLCARLGAARHECAALARDKQPSAAAASALRLAPNNLPASASSPSQYYCALLELVKGVLDGIVEPPAYEDAAREMLGIKAYPAYTLDKLVSIAVRQLQHIVMEPWSLAAAEMAARGMRGSRAHVRRAARHLHHHTAFLVRVYGGDECKVTYELLEGSGAEGRTSPNQNNDNSRLSPTNQSVNNENGSAVARLAAWSLYTERYARGAARGVGGARGKPVFLLRNARASKCGGYTHNAHSLPPRPAPAAPPAGAPHLAPRAKRKPTLRLHDNEECSLTHHYRSRPVAFRELSLYQPGSLSSARASHPRLHQLRRDKFRKWLRDHHRPT